MRRVVVKVGSSSLTDAAGRLDAARLAEIAGAVERFDAQVALVSSGAVAAGRGALGRGPSRSLAERQALAAVGQAALMQCWAAAFTPRVVSQFLLSAGDIHSRTRYVNAKQAFEAAFRLGTLPIVNENDTVATEELKLGDNDTLSAWVAYLINADLLVLLTDVDALYTADPVLNPGAERIPFVEDPGSVERLAGGAGSGRGTGGMRTKLQAAKIAAEAGIETVVLGGGGPGLERWLAGEDTGTRFAARPGAARRGWLLHQPVRGTVRVDGGAVRALREGRSLLPSGIRSLEGRFELGDVVAVAGPDGTVAHGIVNYSSSELRRIAGAHTAEIEARLGYKGYDEAIHRDHLALVSTGAAGIRSDAAEVGKYEPRAR